MKGPTEGESRYNVHVDRTQGAVIGDRPEVHMHFDGKPDAEPHVIYWVGRPASLGKGFYGRGEDLKAVASAFEDDRAVVVSGGAGSGKSRLAAEHAHEAGLNGFWTSGETTVSSTLSALAPAFGLDVEGKSDDDIAAEVQRRLSTLPPETLWVVDNLQDLELVNRLLGASGSVRLLITTRDSRHNLLAPSAAFRPIEALGWDPAIDLLCSRSETSRDDSAVAKIAESVGYLPLALEVLAVRLGESRQTAEKVLAQINEAPTSIQVEAFNKATGASIPPKAEGVFAAIVGTLQSLSAEDREALGGLAYIADAPVPDALAAALTGLDDDGLDSLLSECSRQSVLSWAAGRVRIHALTVAALAATNSEGVLTTAVERAGRRLVAINWDDPISLRAEIVHHEAIRSKAEESLGAEERLVFSFGDGLATGYNVLGMAQRAIQMWERNLPVLERLLGPQHRDTLASRHNLAIAYRSAGRIEDAIKSDEQNLDLTKQAFGADHPETLQSRVSLANSYRASGRITNAIELYEQTLQVMEGVLGPQHRDTLSCRNGLALGYRLVGRIDDAIEMDEQTLHLREHILGPEHPDTLAGRGNLAGAYGAAGRSDDAIRLFERTLEAMERVLGSQHPNTLMSRRGLVIAYRQAGRTEDAERLEASLDE